MAHAKHVEQCRSELLERAAETFASEAEKRDARSETLHAKIEGLALEIVLSAGALGHLSNTRAKRWSARPMSFRSCGTRS